MVGLYDDAELYHLVPPRDEEMEHFYVKVAGGSSRKVLELACGSGRFTLPLAKSGAQVTAGDPSKNMLERARPAARDGDVAIDFFELDMRNFQLGRQFDPIVVVPNSLMHLHTAEDFAQAFTAIRRHLAPGGTFAFDIFVPSPLAEPSTKGAPMAGQFYAPDISARTTPAPAPGWIDAGQSFWRFRSAASNRGKLAAGLPMPMKLLCIQTDIAVCRSCCSP